MMNTKQRYRMGYLGWLKETVSDFVDKKMLEDMVYGFVVPPTAYLISCFNANCCCNKNGGYQAEYQEAIWS